MTKQRVILYLAVLCTMAGMLVYSEPPATARPLTQRIFTYYEDASQYATVGVGATSCYTGSFEMLWGDQTPYYSTESEWCSSSNDCRTIGCPYNYQWCDESTGICRE